MKLFIAETELGDILVHAKDKEEAEKILKEKLKEMEPDEPELEIFINETTEESSCFPLAGYHE